MSEIESLERGVKLLEQRRAKLVQKRNSELNQYFKNFFHRSCFISTLLCFEVLPK